LADTGAVRNRKSVISSSCRLASSVPVKKIIDAVSVPPTPSVVAFVGPCSRM
jgi:hypothetical protein